MVSLDEICIKADYELAYGNYHQALNHYNDALMIISSDTTKANHALSVEDFQEEIRKEANILIKRSMTLFCLRRYFYAYEDAKSAIRIQPQRLEGYLRKAEIECECRMFDLCLKSYQIAMEFAETKSQKIEIDQKIKNVLMRKQRDRINDYQIIWVGTAIGMVCGMALVTWDFIHNRNDSFLRHPIVKLISIGIVSAIFYYMTSLERYLNRKYHQNLLSKPLIFKY
ncbi:hypothetical protein NH340_JMT01838 [Sarcoptes scabiei]|nr:hypothetical protein NH340_JMT01838 [Sarcoptes scabiei]